MEVEVTAGAPQLERGVRRTRAGWDAMDSTPTRNAVRVAVPRSFRYGSIALATTAIGIIGMAAFLAWPRAPLDSGGVPTVVFEVLAQVLVAFFVLVMLCLASLVAALVSVARRERFRGVVLAVASVDALVLAVAARLVWRGFDGGL